MKRVYAALASAAILVVLLPSAVSADRVSKGHDHYVFAGCDAPIDGGFVSAFLESSTAGEFSFMGLSIWLDPDVPFETDPTISGSTETVDLTDDGTTIEAHASFQTFDIDGNPAGDADLTITVARTGDIRPILPEPGKTNVNDKTCGVEELLEGSGTLTWDGSEYRLAECGGVVGDVDFFTTNPRAFVSANTGVSIDCEWETDTVVGAFVITMTTVRLLRRRFPADPRGDAVHDRCAAGFGHRVRAGRHVRARKLGERRSPRPPRSRRPVRRSPPPRMARPSARRSRSRRSCPSGSIEYSTGDTFVIDDEHCDAASFEIPHDPLATERPEDRSGARQRRAGGRNRAPSGSRFNTTNVGATPEPEVQIQTCPEGIFDHSGDPVVHDRRHRGTGHDRHGGERDRHADRRSSSRPMRASRRSPASTTSSSNPWASTYQAALTFDTEEGVTYYVEIGGYFYPFDDAVSAEKGRIRIRS